MNINKAIGSTLMGVAMGLAVVGAASANISPAAPGTPLSVVASGGVFTYTYAISVDAQQTITPGTAGPTGTGDFFTFYDIPGFVTGSASTNAGWSSMVTATGPTATGGTGTVNPTDSALPNLTFTYTGSGPLVGAQPLGLFSFQSTIGTVNTVPMAFVGRATISNSTSKNANLTQYYGPAPSNPTPEPATVVPFALGGLGLLGLAVRKTRRTSGAAA